MSKANALALSNIAFIKYWGNADHPLRIPSNGSISMNMAGFETRTQVEFGEALQTDSLCLNGKDVGGIQVDRVSAMLDRVRAMAGINLKAAVSSENNFPTGAGIASSASAFSALALAASTAAGLELEEAELSRLARTGSGSASRSIPGGFVEWQAGDSHESSYAFSIALPDHWDLVDCVAVCSTVHKPTGSTQGHALADTSPLQAARVADAGRRLELCRDALLKRDFEAFADVVELDNNLMHAVMMTSNPRLIYWQPASLAILQAVPAWRAKGIPVCYTVDAGPNVHMLTLSAHAAEVQRRLADIPGVIEVRTAEAGGPARLVL